MHPRLEKIQALANSRNSRKEFCEQFLENLSNLTNAQAGAIWDGRQPFELVCQHAEHGPVKIGLTQDAHNNLLRQGLTQAHPLVLKSSEGQDGMPCILLGRFERFGQHIVELFVDPKASGSEQEVLEYFGTALRIANQNSDGTGKVASLDEQPGDAFKPDDVSNFLAAIHQSIDRKSTSKNVVNETRRLLDCDRATVLLWHRGKFRVFAISGQVSVNRRSNTVRNLEKLAARITKTEETFWYPEETEIPPQISQVLDTYLTESATRSFIVKPIFEKEIESVEDPDSLERKGNRVIGSLVLEHCNEQWERKTMEPKVEFVTRHVGNAVRNANNHSNLFLYPVWKWLGKSRLLAAPRLLPKVLMVSVALLITVLFLIFWQVEFYVSADGVLVPVNRVNVFPPRDAVVTQIAVSEGDVVDTTTKLIQLSSPEFDLQYQTVLSELSNLKASKAILENERSEGDEEAMATTAKQLSLTEAEIKTKTAILQELEKTKSALEVHSPLAGTVITWDLENRLKNRPVSSSQILMEIADTDGPWHLEVELPDRRVGHLIRAMEDRQEEVEVSYLLAADAMERRKGKVKSYSLSTRLNADNQQVVKVLVELEKDEDLGVEQARTGVQVKIYCGECSLGYLWLHDIGEFLDKNVWFYFQ